MTLSQVHLGVGLHHRYFDIRLPGMSPANIRGAFASRYFSIRSQGGSNVRSPIGRAVLRHCTQIGSQRELNVVEAIEKTMLLDAERASK